MSIAKQDEADKVPTHFFVEIKSGDKVSYAICERIMLVEAGQDGLSAELIQQCLERNPLRAAAIPTSGGGRSGGSDQVGPTGWLDALAAFQSGRSPSFNINIYNAPTGKDPTKDS